MTSEKIVTAAMLAIGDELLSGRTKDKNIGHLADVLTLAGIDLKEVRIVADDEPAIVAALNGLRANTITSSPPAVSVQPMMTSPPMRCRERSVSNASMIRKP